MENTPLSYCTAVRQQTLDPVHQAYHDEEYGFPLHQDAALFGRLVLEINQAGLSWTTILKKKPHFFEAYAQFNIEQVAAFGPVEEEALLQNPGIIRNRLKVEAAIYNAQQILKLQQSHGSFQQWLKVHHLLALTEWVKLFKKTFKFTGGEITKEFLMSTGFLPGAHDPDCPVYERIIAQHPPWHQTA